MDATTVSRSSIGPRWVVLGADVAVLGFLIGGMLGRPSAPVGVLQSLGLLAIALTIYLCSVLSTTTAVVMSGLTLLGLAWTWGVTHHGQLGIDLVALGVLGAVTLLHQRQQSRRLLRMRQTLEDLQEEHTVKDQAMALAGQTHDALQQKYARYAKLQAIAEQLCNLTDLEAIAQLAVEQAFALIGKSDVCALYLVDKERQKLSLVASKKRDGVASIRTKHGDQFDRHVLRSHRPLLVDDVRRDFRFNVSALPDRTISSVIACPLMLGQNAEGVLRLDSARPGVYTQDDLRLLDILLDLVATAVTNAKLFAQTQQLALTDGLTGLALRRPFLEQLTRELARAHRNREPVSMLLLDVDHFKAFNDTFGHTAGDHLLQQLAEVLRTVAPPGAVHARYGGEEFAVLLPRISRDDAGRIAETVRAAVERDIHGGLQGTQRSVTVSMGVASCPDDAKADLELIRVADQRLYQAKHAGRNRVCSS